MKIVTNRVYPPIPDRGHDFCAYLDGFEEDQQYGWGRTKEAAIENLIDSYGDAFCHECYEQIWINGEGMLHCPQCRGTKVTELEEMEIA